MRESRITRLLVALPPALAVAAFFLALGGRVGTSLGLDYGVDAGPAIAALSHGDIAHALALQPVMGPLSILLRAPFAALVPAANLDAAYALGLLPCVAVVLLVLRSLRTEVARRWPEGPARAQLPWLFLASAPVLEAILYGHPEEVLGGALIVAGALAAIRRQALLCGLLLGLAMATKQWGLFALLPILACGTGGRARTAVGAIAVAAALTVPFALGNSAQFTSVSRQATVMTAPLTPLSAWVLASPGAGEPGVGLGGFTATLRAPDAASWLSRPLMGLAILALSALALVRPPRRREDVLGLLALVFLARCALDNVDNVYYHAPMLLCLAAWESLAAGRLPRLAVLSSGVLGLIALSSRLDGTLLSAPAALYLAWAAGVAIVVGRGVFGAPQRAAAALPAGLQPSPTS